MTVNVLDKVGATAANAAQIAEAAGVSVDAARKALKDARSAGLVAFEKIDGEYFYTSKDSTGSTEATAEAPADENKVVFPIELKKNDDGSWVGTMGGFNVDGPSSQSVCRRLKKAAGIGADQMKQFDKDWRIALSTTKE